MASQLNNDLKEKIPKIEVMIGCGVKVECTETGEGCSQLSSGSVVSHSTPDGWVVDSLPENYRATGCSGCERFRS